jgi:4-hydroxythreonine-4-phosphate dehydrogenase
VNVRALLTTLAMSSKPAPLALTLGDAAGISPEIIVKLHAQGLSATCLVYGDAGALRRAVKMFELDLQVNEVETVSAEDFQQLQPGHIFVKPTQTCLPADLPLGIVDPRCGQVAYEALCLAIDDALAGKVSGIVTAPLNKQALHAAGLDFPGHTEILAARTHSEHVSMMLVNEELRVMLVTIHEALAAVPELITESLELATIKHAHAACQRLGIKKPRIAVAGLNPHAGEGGKFGRQDVDVISPAIAQALALGINASGPWPGDTIFMRARRGEFDIVVAQYHDQGLIPIKYLGVDHGINVTIGLPFVRTSVDHGTAFDIAGKGLADPSSLRAAFELARSMSCSAVQGA